MNYHNHPEKGPQRCHADPDNPRSTGCPYGDSEHHYPTRKEAETAFQKLLEEKHGVTTTISSDERVRELKELVYALPLSPTVEEVETIGETFNNIVKERLGFDPDNLEFAKDEGYLEVGDELRKLGIENRKLLGELFPTGNYNNKLRGNRNHQYHLKEALENLPNGVLDRVTGDIHLKIERKETPWGGEYSRGAKVSKPQPPSNSYSIPEIITTGDYYYDQYGDPNDWDSFAVEKIVRGKGEPLINGESPKIFLDDKTTIEVLQKGLVDIDFRIAEGKAEEFEKEYPKISEQMKKGVVTESHYLGEKPRGMRNSLRKTGEEVTIKDRSGREHVMKLPVYRRFEDSIDYEQHTITATKDSGVSTLLHEYCHAIQGSYPEVNVPTEKEAFEKFSKGEAKSRGHYQYFEGGPDEYMFSSTGRELFPRATEGFFYPLTSDYLYGSESLDNNGKKVRDWVAGVWLSLGRNES